MKKNYFLIIILFITVFFSCDKNVNLSPSVNVYVAGEVTNLADRSSTIAKYWKNGTPMNLTDGSKPSMYATGIVVSGNDVYVSGYEIGHDNLFRDVALYWKTESL